MAVYVDEAIWPWRGKKWAHLMADDLDELHRFAASIGLQRSWFQNTGDHPHYDVTEGYRKRAIVNGAIAVTGLEMVRWNKQRQNKS